MALCPTCSHCVYEQNLISMFSFYLSATQQHLAVSARVRWMGRRSTDTELTYFSHSSFNSLRFRPGSMWPVATWCNYWAQLPNNSSSSYSSHLTFSQNVGLPRCIRKTSLKMHAVELWGELPRLLRLISLSVVIEKGLLWEDRHGVTAPVLHTSQWCIPIQHPVCPCWGRAERISLPLNETTEPCCSGSHKHNWKGTKPFSPEARKKRNWNRSFPGRCPQRLVLIPLFF